jgi:hypothetical protein
MGDLSVPPVRVGASRVERPADTTQEETMSEEHTGVLAKVRKLLAKAEDPAATVDEAETYTAKAAALVAEYGIDEAMLAAADPERDVVGDAVVVLDAPYALDKADLLSGVAVQLRCRAVQRTRHVDAGPFSTRKEISVHLFGYGADLTRAEVLYTSLLLQATTQLTRIPAPPGESVAAFRRSWLAGFTSAVVRRVAAVEEAAARRAAGDGAGEGPGAGAARGRGDGGHRSVALVLADRGVQVDTAVREEYPHLGFAPPRRLSGSGGLAGWAAGQRADRGAGTGVADRKGRRSLAG